MTFMPLSREQLFNSVTDEDDFVPPADAAIYLSPTLPAEERQSWQKAYPARVPMEKTKGWRDLTQGFLAHDMATNFDMRRANWEEAQCLYFCSVEGDIRIVADFAAEPADGFLRRELIPILQLRAKYVTINHRSVDEFMASTGWNNSAENETTTTSAQIIPFPRKAP